MPRRQTQWYSLRDRRRLSDYGNFARIVCGIFRASRVHVRFAMAEATGVPGSPGATTTVKY
jgi:hypothetical protein